MMDNLIAPSSSNICRSKISPSMGFSSIFQSPVCTIVPSAQRSTKPQQSGMECVTRIGSHLQGPTGQHSAMLAH